MEIYNDDSLDDLAKRIRENDLTDEEKYMLETFDSDEAIDDLAKRIRESANPKMTIKSSIKLARSYIYACKVFIQNCKTDGNDREYDDGKEN